MNGDQPVQPAAAPPESPWQYKSTSAPTPADPTLGLDRPKFATAMHSQEVTWSASEFIEHNKGIGWFASLVLIVVVLDVLAYFLTKDVVSIIAITAMGIIIGVVAVRKPRTLEYTLNDSGLIFGTAFHPYKEFRSFALMQDSNFPSIMFLPVKRFMPSMSVYYDPQDQERILEVLGQHLPMEVRKRDAADNLSRRIRL